MYQNTGYQWWFIKVCEQNVSLNYDLNYMSIDPRRVSVSIGMIKRWKNSTSIHTARCHRDAGGSCGSWPWRRAQRTSCHWGSKCPAPRADLPRGCPASGSEGSPSTRDACPATPAGNTWSGCSPVNRREREKKTGQRKYQSARWLAKSLAEKSNAAAL